MGNKKQNTEDYFSLNNLNKLCGIDEHLAIVEEIVKKYSRGSSDSHPSDPQNGDASSGWDSIYRQLRLIQKKKDDRKLNISVIGEFSTGKSTFINALLRKELMVSSAMQGTTVASTIIDYGSRYQIEVQYLDGRSDQKLDYPDFMRLKKGLDRLTTDPSEAKQLKAVNVSMPAEILKNSFRIIDTPGTNVTEAWQEEVTIRTLKEISDLSIVLISAEKPASETMLRFVGKNLESILPQCVFVVTKLDMIRPRERSRLLAYVKMKLEEELEIQNAVVLPYVSPTILLREGLQEGSITDDELLNLSLETERKLIEHTAKLKTLAVTKKLTALIDDVYKSISLSMEKISEEYENRLKFLERSKKADLESFVRREKECRLNHYDSTMRMKMNDMEEEIQFQAEKARENVIACLDKKGSLDQLKVYMNGALGDDCRGQAMAMIAGTDDYCREIRTRFKNEMNSFKQAFSRMYQTLNIIPIDMSQPQYDLPEKVEIETANIASAAAYIAEQLASENKAFLGGAATGAAIGTAIMPGIGTILGVLGGLFAGAAMAPDTNKAREHCKDKLRPQLINYYNSVSDKMLTAIDKYSDQIRACLEKEIDEYLKRYRSEVDRQIAVENGQRSAVYAKINSLKADRNRIEHHKIQLESVIMQLNRFGRKDR